MNSFHESTQNKNWIKTEEEIDIINQKKVERILARIGKINKLINEENENKKLSDKNITTQQNSNIPKDNNNNVYKKYINPKKLISLEEEKLLIIYYTKQLTQMNYKSTSFKNNSLTYFRRFFFKRSIIDYDLDNIAAASVFLGSKTAQINLKIEDLKKHMFPNINENELIENEFNLIILMDYNFYVYNPYQALMGFIYELVIKNFFLGQNSKNAVKEEVLQQECFNIIDKMYLTDNIFLFSYSYIALASLFIICEQKNVELEKVKEKLELNKVLNIEDFEKNILIKIKNNLDKIPNLENDKEKCKEIIKKVNHFQKSFPQYKKKLEEEKINYKKKLGAFVEDFNKMTNVDKSINNKHNNSHHPRQAQNMMMKNNSQLNNQNINNMNKNKIINNTNYNNMVNNLNSNINKNLNNINNNQNSSNKDQIQDETNSNLIGQKRERNPEDRNAEYKMELD